jgi:glycine/D-amino acid oxidase-like deaminating enzyme
LAQQGKGSYHLYICPVQTDYLIIGQGIAGTFLSWNLLRNGKSVIVIDENNPATASRVASGIINPVTGRRLVRTWMIEELLPFAAQAYEDIRQDLGMQVCKQTDIVNFHATEQMSNAWHERISEGEEYLHEASNIQDYARYFTTTYGVGITSPGLLIDLQALLPAWRNELKRENALLEGFFNIEDCLITPTEVQYKDIKAKKLILCNGIQGFDNNYFKKLPYAFSKGEMLIARIQGLPADSIFKQGITIVPLHDDYFWIGSSFEWEFEHANPTKAFREKTEAILSDWLKLPYKIIDHKAAIRPASLERRPFVGLHPHHPSVGILNGMGTKGCSLAPYFSHQFVANLLHDKPINPLADIHRFTKTLSA